MTDASSQTAEYHGSLLISINITLYVSSKAECEDRIEAWPIRMDNERGSETLATPLHGAVWESQDTEVNHQQLSAQLLSAKAVCDRTTH